MCSTIALNRYYVGILVVYRDANRFTICNRESISKKCSPSLLNSIGLCCITIKKVFITFIIGSSIVYSRASVLLLISKLSRGAANSIPLISEYTILQI